METVRPVVAVDIDEVLCKFVQPLAEFAAREFGASPANPKEWFSYTFREVWQIDEVESTRRVQAFLSADDFKRGLPLVDGAQAAIAELASRYNLVVVTSRQKQIEEETRAWLDRNFPNCFSAVYFGNHWGLTGTKQSKSEMCLAAGAVCLIDDSVQYCLQCAKSLKFAVLFGSYGWNQTDHTRPDILDCPDWPAVIAAIDARLTGWSR